MRGSWRPNRTAIYWPPLSWPSALCLSRSPGLLNRRPRSQALCWMMAFFTASYHQLLWTLTHQSSKGPFGLVWLSLPQLISNSNWSLLVLTELYNSSTPTQSPTQFLEWHFLSSSSGNNCHAVQRSLSSGASVYECIMGFFFTLSHFISQIPPTRFLSTTGHWDVSLPSGASLWNIIFARVEGQNETLRVTLDYSHQLYLRRLKECKTLPPPQEDCGYYTKPVRVHLGRSIEFGEPLHFPLSYIQPCPVWFGIMFYLLVT